MRIAVDAMGGDYAPREIIRGAQSGLRFLAADDRILLYGPPDQVDAQRAELGLADPRVEVVPCSQTIDNPWA